MAYRGPTEAYSRFKDGRVAYPTSLLYEALLERFWGLSGRLPIRRKKVFSGGNLRLLWSEVLAAVDYHSRPVSAKPQIN